MLGGENYLAENSCFLEWSKEVRRPGRRRETVFGVGEGLNSLHPPKIARLSDTAPVGLEWPVG